MERATWAEGVGQQFGYEEIALLGYSLFRIRPAPEALR
jgi:hypothetical protein